MRNKLGKSESELDSKLRQQQWGWVCHKEAEVPRAQSRSEVEAESRDRRLPGLPQTFWTVN